jgi:hypothetical protein
LGLEGIQKKTYVFCLDAKPIKSLIVNVLVRQAMRNGRGQKTLGQI